MPIYEFRCTHCGKEIEVLQKISDPLPTHCPSCGQVTLTKKLSAAGFQLKGSGWYATDFKGSTAAPSTPAPTSTPPCAATGSCPACE
ncbi:MAG: zinc ribbon domain-containing protein [Betaproteobacteria bacterium]|jgi:putative regulatory protein, FmdB family|nr:zinc ribbon domain-containing protein [Betaproteobacteria bacterium]